MNTKRVLIALGAALIIFPVLFGLKLLVESAGTGYIIHVEVLPFSYLIAVGVFYHLLKNN